MLGLFIFIIIWLTLFASIFCGCIIIKDFFVDIFEWVFEGLEEKKESDVH